MGWGGSKEGERIAEKRKMKVGTTATPWKDVRGDVEERRQSAGRREWTSSANASTRAGWSEGAYGD